MILKKNLNLIPSLVFKFLNLKIRIGGYGKKKPSKASIDHGICQVWNITTIFNLLFNLYEKGVLPWPQKHCMYSYKRNEEDNFSSWHMKIRM
jgi:hypothetical protein